MSEVAEFFRQLHPVAQALLAGLFTWLITALWRSLSYGQASALVEPVAAALGAAVVMVAQPVLPYALSFAAGAMIFVVVEELIPESHRSRNHDLATIGALAGFVVMMVLDVAFR